MVTSIALGQPYSWFIQFHGSKPKNSCLSNNNKGWTVCMIPGVYCICSILSSHLYLESIGTSKLFEISSNMKFSSLSIFTFRSPLWGLTSFLIHEIKISKFYYTEQNSSAIPNHVVSSTNPYSKSLTSHCFAVLQTIKSVLLNSPPVYQCFLDITENMYAFWIARVFCGGSGGGLDIEIIHVSVVCVVCLY